MVLTAWKSASSCVKNVSVCKTLTFWLNTSLVFRVKYTYFFKGSILYLLNDVISELKVAFHITLTGHFNHLLDCFKTLSVHRRAVQQQCVYTHCQSWRWSNLLSWSYTNQFYILGLIKCFPNPTRNPNIVARYMHAYAYAKAFPFPLYIFILSSNAQCAHMSSMTLVVLCL